MVLTKKLRRLERVGRIASALTILSLLWMPASQAGITSINLNPAASGPVWEGIGAETRPYIEGSGVDYLGLTPDQMFSKLRNELGVRYGRTVIRIDLQGYNNGQWNWNQPPADSAQFGNVSVWEVFARMQDHGIEPVVTPFFWPEGVVADGTFIPGQPRNIHFLGTPSAYQAVENWFGQLVTETPAVGFTPRLVSLQNEPDLDEHMTYTTTEFTEVTQRVIDRFKQLNANVDIIVADTSQTGPAQSYGPAQFATNENAWFRSIGYHTYGSTDRVSMEGSLSGFGFPFWMTEQAFNYVPSSPGSWDFAEEVAEHFFLDITEAKVTSWFLWYAGGTGNRLYNGTDWNPYAAMMGLIGRHVPLGSRQVYAQSVGDLRVVGWANNNTLYVWVLNRGSVDETVVMQAPNLSSGQAWRVSETERFVSAGSGLDVLCTGNSATLFVGSLISSVTGPEVDDIPDLRVSTGAAAQDIVSLNGYVRDFDYVNFEEDVFGIAWNATDVAPAPPVAVDIGDKVQIDAAPTPADTGQYRFTATNPAGNVAEDLSHFKSSSIRVHDPRHEPDPRLSPRPGNARAHYILDPPLLPSANTIASGVIDITGTGPVTWSGAYINQVVDATGNFDANHTTLADGSPAALGADLQVQVDSSGRFTLQAGADLEGPYLVGVPALKSATDWDGGSILVSGSILSSSRPFSNAYPDYDRDERFEGIQGELTRVGLKRYNTALPNRIPGEALCSWEHTVVAAAASGVQYGSATVILESDLPANLQANDASFPGDHSGNVLRIRVWPNKPIVFLNRVRTLPVGVTEAGDDGVLQPDRPYAFEASVASNAPDNAHTPVVRVALATEAFTEISASGLAETTLPIDGDGWILMRNLLEPSSDALYANPPGIRPVIIVSANPNATGPVDVYIDNASLYRAAYDTDLAQGATRVPMDGKDGLRFPGSVRGDFEESTGEIRGPGFNNGGNANSWYLSVAGEFGESPPGTFIGVLPGDTNTVTKSGDGNWLDMTFFPTAQLPQVLVYRTPPMVQPDDSPWPDGIYELHADYVTPAGANDFVDFNIALADQDFLSWTRYELRPLPGNSQGTQGNVRKIRLTAALKNVREVVAMIIPAQTAPVGTESTVYLDNVELHLIRERPEYWDRSLFESAP